MPERFKKNPLIPAILQVLRLAEKHLAIHELLQAIKQQAPLPKLHENEQMALFRLNWLMMNGLYELQQSFLGSNLYLHISTLDIHLETITDAKTSAKALQSDNLRSYYLDWQHFSDTTLDEVTALLEGFYWPQPTQKAIASAKALLGVGAQASFKNIQLAYRRKVQQCHPDKGGDSRDFIAVQEAYELLKKH